MLHPNLALLRLLDGLLFGITLLNCRGKDPQHSTLRVVLLANIVGSVPWGSIAYLLL
jgi:hypothetical protein